MKYLKYSWSIILILSFLAPSLVFGQESNGSDDITPPGTLHTDFLPISVWYSGGTARAPMLSNITPESREEWRKDLEQIKNLGYNTVRTWIDWASTEPREGEYHFENLNLLFELAEDIGLKVFIQVYLDSAPDWVGEKYPDSYFTTQSGEKMLPQAAPGYSIDHPRVRKAIREFMTKTAEQAVQYSNLYGWDIWSEPHLINWASAPWMNNEQFGFNPFTQERFRDWLKNKYGSVEKLNDAWYRTFDEWSDVQAPRLRTILSFTDYIDWRLFLYDKMTEDVRFRYDTIRRVDKKGMITSHASPVSLYASPFSGRSANDDFMISDQLDFYGMSLYPKHNDPSTHYETWQIRSLVDFAYSANKEHGGFMVGEFQSGQGTVGLRVGDPVTADDQRVWLWSVISGGAKGVNIYAFKPMSSGYESGGYGLMNVDGSVTDRAISTGKIANLINEHSNLFANSYPVEPEIAILYHPLAQMAGGVSSNSPAPRMYTNSLLGYYRYFSERNIPIDFIHRRDIEEGDVSQYKLIIIPSSLMFTQKAADGVKRYVANGGHVVGEARMAWNDERGYASNSLPGMGLHELFGVQEDKIIKRDEFKINVTNNYSNSNGFETLNEETGLTGALFAESLEILPDRDNNLQVLAAFEDGTPAITTSDYGDGGTVFIGSFLGLANQTIEGASENNQQFLRNLMEWSDVQLPFRYSLSSMSGEDEVQIRLQQNKNTGDYLLFIINHNESSKDISVELDLEKLGIDASKVSLSELTNDKQMQKNVDNESMLLETTLPGRGAEVWHIQH